MSSQIKQYTPVAIEKHWCISNKHRSKWGQNIGSPPSLFNWANDYVVSQEDANKIANPSWIIENLIIQGHIILIPAEPNGGKTTIMFHLAGIMAQRGYRVFYVNSDISGGDAKDMIAQAKDDGFTLMLPDMKVGKSMESVVQRLLEMSKENQRFDDVVFIFDTLKKIINVINKKHAKLLFSILRKLSAKGMTVILLAHTNKYNDADDKPIYEGTGDMRSDVDELIYFVPQKNDDGSMTVSTDPDKIRGDFTTISFNIDSQRNVTQLTVPVNTIEAKRVSEQRRKDEPIITSINNALLNNSKSQKAIIEYCNDGGVGERRVKSVLKHYLLTNNSEPGNKIWKRISGDKNSYEYSIIDPP